jgi:transcription elongation factor
MRERGGQHGSNNVANANRIVKDKLIDQTVMVIGGPFKGQKGRVVHMNGDTARLEMSIRAKQVFEHRDNLKECSAGTLFQQPKHDDQTAGNNNSYNTGGATAYNGGQTQYDAGGATAHGGGMTAMYTYGGGENVEEDYDSYMRKQDNNNETQR